MADFPLPKTPGGTAWGSGPRFRRIKVTPGPLDYETASTVDMSRSMLSTSISVPTLSFTTYVPTSKQRSLAPEGDATLLQIPRFPATQPGRLHNAPVYSIASKARSEAVRTPGPGKYRTPERSIVGAATTWSSTTDDRFGGGASDKSVDFPSPNSYTLASALSTQYCPPFCGRGKSAMLAAADRSPGPLVAGSAAEAKDAVLPASPARTIALKEKLPEIRESPGPNTYQARCLYWSGNKRPLGRSSTPHGRRHTAVPMSLHKSVSAAQFDLKLPRRP